MPIPPKTGITENSLEVYRRQSRRSPPPALDSSGSPIDLRLREAWYEKNFWCSRNCRLSFLDRVAFLPFDLLSKPGQSRKRRSRSKGADVALRLHTFVILTPSPRRKARPSHAPSLCPGNGSDMLVSCYSFMKSRYSPFLVRINRLSACTTAYLRLVCLISAFPPEQPLSPSARNGSTRLSTTASGMSARGESRHRAAFFE